MDRSGTASLKPESNLAATGPTRGWVVEFVEPSRAAAGSLAPWTTGESKVDLFQTLDWFDNLARHGVDRELVAEFALARHESGAAFVWPLLHRDAGSAAAWGGVTGGLSTYYSSLYGPVGDPAAVSVSGLRAVLAALKRHRSIQVLDFQPLNDQGAFVRDLETALRMEGYITDRYFCFGNWYLDVGGRRFADYEPAVPSRLRNTGRRGRKKLDGAGPWSLDILRSPGPALENAIRDWNTIYLKSWKQPEPFPDFVPNLCRMAAQRGWLRLGLIRLNGLPIAAQIWLVKDGCALIYKLAYDEEQKSYSAGTVLSLELFRMALDDDGVHEVDYLTGDDAYKADWMNRRRERIGLVAFKKLSARGLASWARHALGRWWRQRAASPRQASTTPPSPTGNERPAD